MILRATRVHYNWHTTHEEGEDYFSYEVGKSKVIMIEIHERNDIKYALVFFENGERVEQYNLNKIVYQPTEVTNERRK